MPILPLLFLRSCFFAIPFSHFNHFSFLTAPISLSLSPSLSFVPPLPGSYSVTFLHFSHCLLASKSLMICFPSLPLSHLFSPTHSSPFPLSHSFLSTLRLFPTSSITSSLLHHFFSTSSILFCCSLFLVFISFISTRLN